MHTISDKWVAVTRYFRIAITIILTATAVGCFVGNLFGGELPPLAYVMEDGSNAQIWVVDPNSDESFRVSGRSAYARHPRWSTERRLLAWISVGNPSRLMFYDTDSGDVSTLVDGVEDSQPPVWSPDGSRIAYVANVDGEPDIYMVDLSGSPATRLTFNDALERIGDWSPDGQWLVFNEAGSDGLLLRNPDGVNRILLTDGPDTDPVWSPKGDRIAFLRQADDGRDVYVLRPTNSGNWAQDTDELLVSNLTEDEFSLSWSADGRRIAFAARGDEQSEIYTVLVDGTDLQRLTHNRANDLSPRWSSTGDKIAFVSHAYGNAEILYMNSDGTRQQRLTTNDHSDTQPDW